MTHLWHGNITEIIPLSTIITNRFNLLRFPIIIPKEDLLVSVDKSHLTPYNWQIHQLGGKSPSKRFAINAIAKFLLQFLHGDVKVTVT